MEDPKGSKQWRVLRRGLADFHRRAQVCQQINERYLEALAQVDDDTTLQELTQRLEQPRRWKGRRVRALHPFSADDQLWLQAVNRGEYAMNYNSFLNPIGNEVRVAFTFRARVP